MSNGTAVLSLDGEQGSPGRQSVAIRPVAARMVETAAFAGMLDGKEERASVGREFAAADFAAQRAAGELLRQAALGTAGGDDEAAIVRQPMVVGITDDPEPSL